MARRKKNTPDDKSTLNENVHIENAGDRKSTRQNSSHW